MQKCTSVKSSEPVIFLSCVLDQGLERLGVRRRHGPAEGLLARLGLRRRRVVLGLLGRARGRAALAGGGARRGAGAARAGAGRAARRRRLLGREARGHTGGRRLALLLRLALGLLLLALLGLLGRASWAWISAMDWPLPLRLPPACCQTGGAGAGGGAGGGAGAGAGGGARGAGRGLGAGAGAGGARAQTANT